MNATSYTKDHLLDVAEELVQRRGYHAFSYADLSRAVGIKTASIHYHYPAKEDLVRAVVERYRARFGEELAILSAEERDPIVRVERYIATFRRTFADEGRICLCGSLAADALTLGDSIRREIRLFFEENEAWLRSTLEEAEGAGQLRAGMSPELTARALLAGLEGSMLSARVSGSGDPIDEFAEWFRVVLR